jgi:hypothetical protein
MVISNRFRANKKNKGTMTFSISENDWRAMKILCEFYECSPGEIISELIQKAIEPYEYYNKVEEKVEEKGE